MRSMYGPDALLLASKKPRIVALVSRAGQMTVDEIHRLDEKPDVIKGLLIIKQLGTTKGTVAEKIASKMQESAISVTNPTDRACAILRICHTTWVTTGKSQVELMAGWLWGDLGNGLVRAAGAFMQASQNDYETLKANSVQVEIGTIERLKLMEKDRLSKL